MNNVYVSATNHGFDPLAYLKAIPREAMREFHLAGFTVNRLEVGEILIDTHNRPVAEPVWALYREAVKRFGAIPTLVEWDSDIPSLDVLLDEAATADAILEERHALFA